MLIIPAVDIKEGRCVRLVKGDPNQETVYSDSPVDQAKHWENEGAKLLHVVDLDGAFQGTPKNLALIQEISEALTIDIELGGGIRNMSIVEQYIEIGIKRIIIGSAAYEDKKFLKEACTAFPGSIIVGIDVLDNCIAIHGWKDVTKSHFYDFASEIKDYGVKELIITDISRDGMLSGISKDFYEEALENIKMPIIASGGVSTIDDIKKLLPLKDKGLVGVIAGKSLYENTLDLKEGLEVIHAG
ncbi:MAG: 1-(5-phosphoribosyl)-5-[(5-phosphoribosylamino) methylideneamino] imidazole-4-carboxamide isomerase [bacterium]|nr:MAG: 1-(5-phosphoribosyl)-5-[(5-phosphoribosylamino) methylideneamino] imidazole-4-carboxamide isomerase [bacterium]